MKNLKFIILGAICFIVANIILTGYGNKSSHREINNLIVEQFNKVFINALFPSEHFKNNLFVFKSKIEFPGSFVNKGGLTQYDVNETRSRLNPLGWIVHGGYSADEPEIFASFRHFYDPTQNEGNRYLHNHLDEFDKKGIIDNPKIDHLKWAVDHYEHQYNWTNGKTAVASALASSDKDFRDEEMAFAWRALGETLHMIGDMGCPAHVRDDAHAAETFTGYKLGSPDPYEEFFEVISAEEGIANLYKAGKVDIELKEKFRKATSIDEIAFELANYTNQNFFTTQTISGDDVVPQIHPEKTYDSPTLDECEYDPDDFAYYKNISGNNVMMCRDLKYSWGIFKGRGYPYIDKKCTYSQGQALLPQIVEAGINVMRLFIPQMQVEIKDINMDDKKLKVRVVHKKSDEYTREIKYNGKVSFYNAKSLKHLADFECFDGEVEEKFRKTDFRSVNWKEHGVYAEINYGGIFIKSEPYKTKVNDELNYLDLYLAFSGTVAYEQKIGDNYSQGTVAGISKDAYSFRGKINRYGNILHTDLIDFSKGQRQSGYVEITMNDLVVEYIEIKDTLTPNNGDSSPRLIMHFKTKRFPFEDGSYDFIYRNMVYDSEVVEVGTHQYAIDQASFIDQFYVSQLILYEEKSDFKKYDWISLTPNLSMSMEITSNDKFADEGF